jgi:hypothetical protein
VVQFFITVSLVVALPHGTWTTSQRITYLVAPEATTGMVGIVLSLAVGSPQGLHPSRLPRI